MICRNWAVALLVAQDLAALAALGAAYVAVQSVTVTGPILVAVGIALSIVSSPWMSWHAVSFSLSAPIVAAIGALVIAVFRLMPDQAHGPIVAILGIYLLLIGPFSIWLYQNVLGHVPPSAKSPMRLSQYNLKSLLGLMTAVAVFAGVSSGLALADFQIVFSLFGVAAIAAAAFIAWRYFVARQDMRVVVRTESPLQPPAD
jgi:hypothetical protein